MPGGSGFPVHVWLFDLTHGLAKQLSASFLGRQIEGVWHTSVVVYGKEHFYGAEGVSWVHPGTTLAGSSPYQDIDLGVTDIPPDIFYEYLNELMHSTFDGSNYNLLEHNCNTFSNEIAQFLTGKSIPSFITSLPSEVMQTPFGQMLRPYLDAMSPRITNTSEHKNDRRSSATSKQSDASQITSTLAPKTETVSYKENTRVVQSCKSLIDSKSLDENITCILENILDAVSTESSMLVFAQQLSNFIHYLSHLPEEVDDDIFVVLAWLSGQRSFLNHATAAADLVCCVIFGDRSNTKYVDPLIVTIRNMSTNATLAKSLTSRFPRAFTVLCSSILACEEPNLDIVATTLYNFTAYKCSFVQGDELIELLAACCHTVNAMLESPVFPEDTVYRLLIFLIHSAKDAHNKSLLGALLSVHNPKSPSKRIDGALKDLRISISA